MIRVFAVLFAIMCAAPASAQPLPAGLDPQNTLILDTTAGRIVIKLRTDVAPHHAERLKELAREHFYDNVPFHRVIDGFMAQTGDPTGTGSGGSGHPGLKAEFSGEPHVRGVVSMARTSDPNSADSQFFICFADARFLDRQYTVWGQVVSGMEHVDTIKKGSSASNGAVTNPDAIVKMQVAADVLDAEAKAKQPKPKEEITPEEMPKLHQ